MNDPAYEIHDLLFFAPMLVFVTQTPLFAIKSNAARSIS